MNHHSNDVEPTRYNEEEATRIREIHGKDFRRLRLRQGLMEAVYGFCQDNRSSHGSDAKWLGETVQDFICDLIEQDPGMSRELERQNREAGEI